MYRYCFGKPADGLERSVEEENECVSYLHVFFFNFFFSMRANALIDGDVSRYDHVESAASDPVYIRAKRHVAAEL